jgi:hypothetical protein
MGDSDQDLDSQLKVGWRAFAEDLGPPPMVTCLGPTQRNGRHLEYVKLSQDARRTPLA